MSTFSWLLSGNPALLIVVIRKKCSVYLQQWHLETICFGTQRTKLRLYIYKVVMNVSSDLTEKNWADILPFVPIKIRLLDMRQYKHSWSMSKGTETYQYGFPTIVSTCCLVSYKFIHIHVCYEYRFDILAVMHTSRRYDARYRRWRCHWNICKSLSCIQYKKHGERAHVFCRKILT